MNERPPLSPDQVHTLQHALGLDRERRKPWRNYYCDQAGAPALEALVELGLMRHGRTLNGGEDRYYIVTDAGIAAALAALPKPRSRASRRFSRFLNMRDAMPDLTFRDFLRLPEAR